MTRQVVQLKDGVFHVVMNKSLLKCFLLCYVQVLAEFDIFSVVGANRPLVLVDLRVVVMDDGLIRVRFEGIDGSPVVCGISLRKAPQVLGNALLLSLVSFKILTY